MSVHKAPCFRRIVWIDYTPDEETEQDEHYGEAWFQFSDGDRYSYPSVKLDDLKFKVTDLQRPGTGYNIELRRYLPGNPRGIGYGAGYTQQTTWPESFDYEWRQP